MRAAHKRRHTRMPPTPHAAVSSHSTSHDAERTAVRHTDGTLLGLPPCADYRQEVAAETGSLR